MRNKTALNLLVFFVISILTFGQEHETVLSAPENWKSEIIPFPLSFAQQIDFVGFEDLRFAPNWTDVSSSEYWTYTFVWYIDKSLAMTEQTLSYYINAYYDGLMGIDSFNKPDSENMFKLDKTFSLFIKTKNGFTGKIRTYDQFFSKDYMTLNIKVRELFCSDSNKQIVLFDISPKEFSHEVWQLFDDVKLDVKCD